MLEKIIKTYSTLIVAGLGDKKSTFTQQNFMLTFRDDFEIVTKYLETHAKKTENINYEDSSFEITEQIRYELNQRWPHRPFHHGIVIAALIAAGFRIERMRIAEGVYTNLTFELED